MSASSLVIPLPKLVSYSDEYLGTVAASYKQLLQWHLPVPETLVIPPATLELMYTSSPMRGKVLELLKRYNESPNPKHKDQAAAHLKQQLASLHLNSEIIHRINHWYHDYFHQGEVRVVASSYPHLVHTAVKGNVNVIESILEVWAASTHEYLTSKQLAYACLSPTPLVLVKEYANTCRGVMFSSHPEQLTKASVVCYFWQTSKTGQTSSPDEIIELDIRSNTIVRRTSGDTAKVHQPLKLTQPQLKALFHTATSIKHHSASIPSISFLFHNNRLLVNELPSSFVLPPSVKQLKRTATHVLALEPSTAELLRLSGEGDGVGIVSQQQCFKFSNTTKKTESQLTDHQVSQITSALEKVLTSAQPAQMTLFRLSPVDISGTAIIATHLDKEITIFSSLQERVQQPLGLLVSGIHAPSQWQSVRKKLHGTYHLPSVKTPIWLEVATPAVAAHLRYFDLEKIQGVVIDIDTVVRLSLGHQDIQSGEADYTDLSKAVITHTIHEVLLAAKHSPLSSSLSLWVKTSTQESDTVTAAVTAGCEAIVCPAAHVPTIRESVSHTEKLIWQHRHRT